MDEPRPAESKTRTAWILAKSLAVIGVALSLFQLYTAGLVAMTAMRHRSVFLTCILVMAFLIKPLYKGARKDRFNVALVIVEPKGIWFAPPPKILGNFITA